MITTVIFDMDGLIFSTEPVYFQCYQQAAKKRGLDFTFELFETCIGISTQEAEKIIRNYFGKQIDVQSLNDECYANFANHLLTKEIEFRPGAKEAIEYFHSRGLKLAVASSNITRWVELLTTRYGVRKYFSSVLTSDDVENPKPDPELYLTTARILGSDVNECLVFEDSVAGATAAISAGMRTCVVPHMKQPNTFTRNNAFKVYQSLEDIYPDVDELLS